MLEDLVLEMLEQLRHEMGNGQLQVTPEIMAEICRIQHTATTRYDPKIKGKTERFVEVPDSK